MGFQAAFVFPEKIKIHTTDVIPAFMPRMGYRRESCIRFGNEWKTHRRLAVGRSIYARPISPKVR